LAQSALQTSSVFLTALQARALVAVRRETVRRAEQQLAIATARLVTAAATVQDSLRALVQLGRARLDLLTVESQLAAAEASLARRLGLPGRVAAQDDGALQVLDQPPAAEALLAEAVARAPSVQRAEAAVAAAEARTAAAKAQYWPSLVVSGSYDYAGNDRNQYTFYNNRSVRLGLNWPLFNGFRREEQVVQAAATLDGDRARAADVRREVAANLTAQLAELEAARQRIALARLSVEAARADVRVALERYQLGTITINDLNQSQDGLTSAEESAVTARIAYLRAKVEIEAILGRRL
jgi:outer membrane protein TolC